MPLSHSPVHSKKKPGFLLQSLAFCAFTAAGLTPLHAADFPTKAINLVVPFPAGGGPDLVARIIGERLSDRLGQAVIVENRPGASGTIGAAHVLRAPADGHTLLLTPSTFSLAPLVLQPGVVSYDITRDFAPVIQPTTSWLVLAAHPSTGVKTLADLKTFTAQGKKANYTGSGSGSMMHVAGELLKKTMDIDMAFVPHRGTSPAIADTIGGHIFFVIAGYQDLMPHFKAGALVPVALLDRNPHPTDPNVVPVAQQGYPDFSVHSWTGVLAAAATPASVIAKLNQEINAVLATPEIKNRLEENGQQRVEGGPPEKLAKTIAHDLSIFGPFVKEANLQAQ